MKPIPIQITESAGISRVREPISMGIPLTQGAVNQVSDLTIEGINGPAQFAPLSYWPDGSCRWVKTQFQINLEPNSTASLTITKAQNAKAATQNLTVKSTQQHITVETGCLSAVVDQNSLRWTVQDRDSLILIKDSQGRTCKEQLPHGWKVIEHGNTCLTLVAEGQWLCQDQRVLANFTQTLRFYYQSATIESETTIHNPKRAHHPGGLWDLGDPGSIYFSDLSIETDVHSDGKAVLYCERGATPEAVPLSDSFLLHQDSSGGDNWNCSNHVNANGEIIPQFKGYRLSYTGKTIEGLRASPTLAVSDQYSPLQIHLKHFWQNFPSAMRLSNNLVSVALFPSENQFPHELQGGERKTQTCYFNYYEAEESLDWVHAPLVPVIAPEHFELSQALPWFKANQPKHPLDSLIQQGLNGNSHFFAKREIIDEFGWRNFGDIFADHETLYQAPDEKPFISHYNNQYDAIYGFSRQFALSGDTRWFELMNDLANHVSDIDIYHTTEDRSEYNNGLFWHTDHYLDAKTATHRTYTKHNDTSSTPGQTGGGPASEHCYTTGLLYHYYFTGNPRSKQAVLELAGWMRALHEGDGGLLEQVLALKKQELPKVKAKLKGQAVSAHEYPFTRGTGNYLNALLDAWHVSGDNNWLTQAETVIRKTINPNDDLTQRELLNAEFRWSYLVLMGSIAKYLSVKQEQQQLDAHYQYALDSFTTYTRWMSEHEQMFLQNPDQLEFPNDTWSAQDIRKAMLMFQAMHFDAQNREKYLNKATQWLDYVSEKLSTSPEAHYARVIIILMQNYGPQHFCEDTLNLPTPNNAKSPWIATQLTWPALTLRIIKRLVIGLLKFRPKKEKAWLKARMDAS